MGGNKPYQEEEWLRQEYVENGRSLQNIADQFGITHQGVRHWMERHGIDRRSQQEAQNPGAKYTDPEWLRSKYHEEGLSLQAIGNLCDTGAPTILKWMRRHGIDRRSPYHDRRTGPCSYQSVYGDIGGLPGGWVQVSAKYVDDNGDARVASAYVHQLIAIAEGADPEKVFSSGDYHIHHENGIRWDNRPENLELVTPKEHRHRHTGPDA